MASFLVSSSQVENRGGFVGCARPVFFRPELDAMRFFAFLCVFLHHTLTPPSAAHGFLAQATLRGTLASSAKFAVSLFFLLSGYLITTLLGLEKEYTGRVHLAAFYQRRIARIWPLYYAFMLLVLLIGTIVPRVLPSAGAVAASTFFSGNWFLILGGSGFVGGLGILWSVNIEEQFYLVWPLFAKYYGRRSLIWISTIIVLSAFAVLIVCGAHGIFSDITLRFNPLVEMQFFAAGALMSIWLPRDGLSAPAPVRLVFAFVGLLCWFVGTRWFGMVGQGSAPAWWMPAALYACVLAGCVLLFLSFFGVPERFFPRKILWLGKISYGLYVYQALVLTLAPRWPAKWSHGAGLAVARVCLELLLVIVLAGLSYRWLELPFLRLKRRSTFISNRNPNSL
jgi:peptidoglycan/LPS O-acetylase OafA/YrhL